jgi:2-iminoacetate synthase ThiH
MFNESQASSSMRAIAIACLTSARDAQIRAPSGRLGVKTAHVALSFGANHLGQVAVDAATAAALNIPTLAELADALRYDTPTPV